MIYNDNDIIYDPRGEYEIYESFFSEIDLENIDDSEKYKKLCNNLDDKSIRILRECIIRVKTVQRNHGKGVYDLFIPEEKERIDFFGQLKENAVKQDDGKFCLDGCILPINDFRTEIFCEKMGLCQSDYLNDRDIIDVGAYIGDSSIVLSGFTNKKVVAIEPVEKNYNLLLETVKINNKDIVPVRGMISDKNCKKNIYIEDSEFLSGSKKIKGRKYSGICLVETRTIDSLVDELELQPGIIKIHAEGAEQEVIRGAKKTIQDRKPTIIVEINHTESDFFDIKPLLEEYNPKYKFDIFMPANRYILLGLKLIARA